MLATLRASCWPLAPLDRLGLRCLAFPAERMLRRCTSVALKKATMKGCLFWGPLRPISPAVRGFTLSPTEGDKHMDIRHGIPWLFVDHLVFLGVCMPECFCEIEREGGVGDFEGWRKQD